MPIYEIAGPDVQTEAKKLIEHHYHAIAGAGVTFRFLMASSKNGEPAITHNGWPALGLCKIVSLKDRVSGLPDVTITIDGDQWGRMKAPERRAILDHELNHVQVIELPASKRSGSRWWKIDDAGRPKIVCRPHDWQLGGFNIIMDTHKEASQEYRMALLLAAKIEQRDLPFEEKN